MQSFLIWPGIDRVYRLVALHDVLGDYETITESNDVREIMAAKRRAERAASWATRALRRVLA